MALPFKSILAFGASLTAFGCAAGQSASQTQAPGDVRALLAPTDVLLAYKTADLYGDGTAAAVIVVRHRIDGASDYDFDNNPCELVVLRREEGKLVEAARSKKAVDCTYNDIARNAPAMSLEDNLSLATARITYANQKAKGDSTLYFAWSKDKNSWYLQRATTSNADGNTVVKESASYPKDFSWTTMATLDPEALAEVLDRQENTSK